MGLKKNIIVISTFTTGISSRDYILEIALKTLSKTPSSMHLKISYDDPNFAKRVKTAGLSEAYEKCTAKREDVQKSITSLLTYIYKECNGEKVYFIGLDTNKDVAFLKKMFREYNPVAYEKLKLVIAQPLLDLSQMIIFRAMEGKISLDSLSLFAIEEYFDIEPDDTNGVAAIYCDTIYQTIRKLYPHMLNAAKKHAENTVKDNTHHI